MQKFYVILLTALKYNYFLKEQLMMASSTVHKILTNKRKLKLLTIIGRYTTALVTVVLLTVVVTKGGA